MSQISHCQDKGETRWHETRETRCLLPTGYPRGVYCQDGEWCVEPSCENMSLRYAQLALMRGLIGIVCVYEVAATMLSGGTRDVAARC